MRAANDAERTSKMSFSMAAFKDETYEVLEHAQVHSTELVDGEYLQRN